MYTKDGFHKALEQKLGDDAYLLLAAGGHKKLADLLTNASLGASGNSTTLSITVGGTTKSNSITVPYAAVAGTWETERILTIGSSGKSVNGSKNVTWSLAEIGAAAAGHNHDDRYVNVSGDTMTGPLIINATGSASNSPLAVGYDSAHRNINTSVADQTTMIQVIAGTGGSTNSSAIGFHNPGISSAVLEYRNTDANTGSFNFRSDNTTWRVGIGTTSPLYKLHVVGDIYANGGWLRSSGQTGWYNESYGGGWYMIDSDWVRTYNGKGVVATCYYASNWSSATYLLRSDGGAAAFNWSGQSGQPTWIWGGNSQHNYYVYNPSNFSVNYANYAGYLTDFERVSRVSKNSSNSEIETVTGWKTSGFIQVQRFCPPEMYRTTGDMPAPYGIGFGNGSESGGIMPIGSGDYLQEIRFYGANSGPTLFTFGTQNWEGSSYDSRYSNAYATYLSINSKNGNLSTSGTLTSSGTTTSSGFVKSGSNDNYILLGGGGHKAVSDFSMAHSHPYLPLAGGTMTGNISFSNSGTGFRGINYGTMGDNDQWRIGGAATGSSAGYMEIATADDGTEPIYVRQYTGVFSTLVRTLTLLDANGYSIFPSYINIGGHEKNASSPPYVWGSNSSDNYLRSYQTSSLSVNYANSAGSAGNADTVDGYHYNNLPYHPINGSWKPSSLSSYTRHWGWAYSSAEAGLASNGSDMQIYTDGRFWQREGAYYCLDNGNTYVSSGTGVINGTTITQVSNADTVDGYHNSWMINYTNTYNQSNSGSEWYLYLSTSSWANSDTVIELSMTGDNQIGHAIIHWLNRDTNGFWGWCTSYNSTELLAVGKSVGAPINLYLKFSSGCTNVNIKSNRSLSIEKGDFSSNATWTIVNGFFCSAAMKANSIWATGFKHSDHDNNNAVLLAGGSWKLESNLSVSYANSAGSVAWGNVTGKPSTFTPSSHSHDYLPLSGGTMTGCITTKTGSSHNGIKLGDTYLTSINGEVIFQNNTAIRFGGDSWDWNVWAELGYVHSSKIIYLGLAGLPYSANSTQSGGNIYTPGISNIYIGNGTYTVLHSGNWSSYISSTISKTTSLSGTTYVVGTSSNQSTFATCYYVTQFYFTTSGAYHTSDIRKKYDIRDIYTDEVTRLFNTDNAFIRHFKWKDTNHDAYGFIAQELAEYCPEAVDLNNDTGYYAVNYNVAFSKIIGAMYKRVKQLENENSDLKLKIEDLYKLINKK